MKMITNWWNELAELLKDDQFEAINITVKWSKFRSNDKTGVYHFRNLDDARELLDYNFNSGFGPVEGPSFILWAKKNIYFSAVYDGAEWIDSIPRNPDDSFSPYHIGQ